MGVETAIGWTDSTFNPWWGCTRVGPGCGDDTGGGCYAELFAHRLGRNIWGPGAPRRTFGEKHWNEPRKWNAAAGRAGLQHKVFCASMADVFDNEAPAGERERLWALIRETPHLTWQIVTKRIGNAKKMLPADWGDGYDNVWLLATMVNQDEVDRDMEKLLDTPARIHGISGEPLLGQMNVRRYLRPIAGGRKALDWVIVGGESGPNARAMPEAWALDLRDQCEEAGTAFFYKQKGGTGRDKGGSVLDGREYKAWPVAA